MSHDDPEAPVLALLDDGQQEAAASALLELYGGELSSYLIGVARNPDVGQDLYQETCVKIWRGLARFQRNSSLRTWCYAIARNNWLSWARRPSRTERLNTEDHARLPGALSRTATQQWRKTEVKQWLWDAIADFPEDDQSLVMLRLGREMRWTDIARIITDGVDPDDPKALKRHAAALRKRYQRLKDKLREQLDP